MTVITYKGKWELDGGRVKRLFNITAFYTFCFLIPATVLI